MKHTKNGTLVRIANNRLYLDHLDIPDRVVVDYIASLPEPKRIDGVTNCLSLGARALASATGSWSIAEMSEQLRQAGDAAKTLLTTVSKNTQDNINKTVARYLASDGELSKTIQRDVNRLQSQLEELLDPDDAESVTRRIHATVLDSVGGLIKKFGIDMDLSNPQSPISQLGTNLTKNLDKLDASVRVLSEKLVAREATSRERNKAAAKGLDFEEAIERALAPLCGPRKDLLTPVGALPGDHRAKSGGRAKDGDFVIAIDAQVARGEGLRVAIEAKHDGTTPAQMRRLLDAAMKNRGAQVAIGISCNPAFLPAGASWIQPIEDDKVLVYAPFDGETGQLETLPIEAAYEMARFKALVRRLEPDEEQGPDREFIERQIQTALNELGRFVTLKAKLTGIKTQTDDAAQYAEGIRASVVAALDQIRASMQHPETQPTNGKASAESLPIAS